MKCKGWRAGYVAKYSTACFGRRQFAAASPKSLLAGRIINFSITYGSSGRYKRNPATLFLCPPPPAQNFKGQTGFHT